MADFLTLAAAAHTAAPQTHETAAAGAAHGAAGAASAGETHATTEAHGGAAHGGGHAEPSAFGLGPGAWVSIAMLILIGIMLWKKVPAMIGKMLDSKIATIRQQLDEAAALRSEAEALKGEYAAKIAGLEGEAAAMRARAEDEARQIVDRAKSDVEQLVVRRQRMAEDRIAAAERSAVADVRERAAKAAVSAASAVIAQKHDAAADRALVDAAIARVGKA